MFSMKSTWKEIKNNKTGGYGIGRSVSDLLEHIAAGA